jgi:hypothetical protein
MTMIILKTFQNNYLTGSNKLQMIRSAKIVFGILFINFFAATTALAQDCAVEMESIRGHYAGDCKKGKANGKGKSTGKDSYEGEFKLGFPEGKGTYTWSNGTVFEGIFSKGMKEGMGVLTYKKDGFPDSVVKGFWKKDVYAGKFEKPFTLYSKGRTFTDVDIRHERSPFNQISIFVASTSGGTSNLDDLSVVPRLSVEDIDLIVGSFGKQTLNDNHAKKMETILSDVIYPIRMQVTINKEIIEIEFREKGSYTVDIKINQ